MEAGYCFILGSAKLYVLEHHHGISWIWRTLVNIGPSLTVLKPSMELPAFYWNVLACLDGHIQ